MRGRRLRSDLRLPAMREQFVDSAVQVRWQPRKHVFQIRPRIVTVHLCRLHQAHDDRGALAGQFTARE